MLPLDGFLVVELGRALAAPIAAMMLADLGATVIKIERPGTGDDMRAYPPHRVGPDGQPTPESAYYLSANRSKQSVVADISTPEGARLVRDLAARADVFIENYKVGDLARRGLGYDSLSRLNPRLVYCSITGFGQTGPLAHRPGFDNVFQSMSGLMALTGTPGGPPMKVGAFVSDVNAGLYAAFAIVGALTGRGRGGPGQHIDISLLDCQIASLAAQHMAHLVSGRPPARAGNGSPSAVPSDCYRTADGWIYLSAGRDVPFAHLCRTLGRPDLAENPDYARLPGRIAHRAALDDEIGRILQTRATAEWSELFDATGVMFAPILSLPEVVSEPQVQARGLFRHVAMADGGEAPMVASPIRYSATPVRTPAGPPGIGENTEAVLRSLGWPAEEISAYLAALGRTG